MTSQSHTAATVESLAREWSPLDTEAFLAEPARFSKLAGRLTAICLDRLPPVLNVRDISDRPGFVARAMDLVRFPDELFFYPQVLA